MNGSDDDEKNQRRSHDRGQETCGEKARWQGGGEEPQGRSPDHENLRLCILACAVACFLCTGAAKGRHVSRDTPAGPCAPALDQDFDHGGKALLEDFLRRLLADPGAAAGLAPGDVKLSIIRGTPKPGPRGVTAGEVACRSNRGNGPYRIILYRNALAGRPLATAYHTVAHEFQHVVQIRRDHLRCTAHGTALVRDEAEADAVASRLAPACVRP